MKIYTVYLQWFDGTAWRTVSEWGDAGVAWLSLGEDNYNYRVIEKDGKVLIEKQNKEEA